MRHNKLGATGRLPMAIVLLWFHYASVVSAQTDTAAMNGFVTDPTGASVPDAIVTAVHMDTNAKFETRANEVGFYVLTPLRTGEYVLAAEAPGFKRTVISGITLQVQQKVRRDIVLVVGQLTEQVTVDWRTPLLNSEESSLGQVISNRSISELPLNGRNYLQLGILAPGMTPAIKGRNNGQDSAFLANGLRYTMNNYLLDGADNNSQITNLQSGGTEITRPSIDAIQEFKIQTSNFSAEFGRSAGAVINVTVKSGTNDFHGTAYEFHRNSALDAKNFFDRPDRPISTFIHNQFGGSFGGPIAKDRTFFFVSWEGMHIRKGLTEGSTVPTLAHRQGDFGSSPVFDPATGRSNPMGSGYVRDLFPNNVIPRNRWDPVSAQLIELYPLPTNPGEANNFTFNPKQSDTGDQYDTRLDHRLSAKDTLYGRFSFLDRDLLVPGPLPVPAVGSGAAGSRTSDQLHTNRNLAVVYTHVFSPRVINEFRFGFNRVRADLRPFVKERLNEDFGIRGVSTNPKVTGLANFQPRGFASLGDGASIPIFQGSQTKQFLESLSILRGKHSLKVGGDIRFPDSFYETYQNSRGLFVFDGGFTQNPQARATSGSSIGDFLLGLPSTGTISLPLSGTLKHRAYQFYVQDDWKITSRLSVNMGLRWELISPFFEKEDRQGNFIIEPDDPAFGTVVQAGTQGRSRGLVNSDRNNIAPRLGLAYQLTPGTVIRAAAGVFFTSNELLGAANRMVANPPFFLNANFPADQITPVLTVRTGFPEDSLTAGGQAPRLISFNPDFPSGYTQQWNLNIQRQLPGDTLLEVAYVGSNSIKLQIPRNVNQPRLGPEPLDERRLFPSFGEVQRFEPMGTSNYHSLQARAEKRYSAGLAFLVAYTLGKALELLPQQASGPLPRNQNHLDLSSERGRTANDARQRFVFSYTYDLPLGVQGTFPNSRFARAVFGGWQLSGILAAQTGLPFTVAVGRDLSNTQLEVFSARPNRIGNGFLPKSQRTVERWFNVNDFVVPAPSTFGNAGRSILDGPGFVNFDLGFNKRFRLSEQLTLQFRSEFFNVLNTPQFDQPGGGTIDTAGRPMITFSNAAVIARTVHDARQIQFGLKLLF